MRKHLAYQYIDKISPKPTWETSVAKYADKLLYYAKFYVFLCLKAMNLGVASGFDTTMVFAFFPL